MDTSLPWLRGRGPLSSRQRETGKCLGGFFVFFSVCWIFYSLLCMGGREEGGDWWLWGGEGGTEPRGL